MKKYKILIAILLLYSNSFFCQFDNTSSKRIFIKGSTLSKSKLDVNTLNLEDDEFLINKNNFIHKKEASICDCKDFQFCGNVGFERANFAVINAGLLLEAEKKRVILEWYAKQRNLIKSEIEEFYNYNFDSYNDAVDKTFIDFGKNNYVTFFDFNRNISNLQKALDNTNRNYKAKNEVNLRELQHLNFRKKEILSGNINNSIFTFSEIYGGIKLRDIKDVNTINRNWDVIKEFLYVNLPTEQNARYHSERLRNLDDDDTFDNFMLGLQRDFYDDELNPGQRLFIEQFSINFLKGLRANPNAFSGPHTINFGVPGGLSKGLQLPAGTESVLQEYLWSYSKKSVFDPKYYLKILDEILVNNGYQPVYGEERRAPYWFVSIAKGQATDRRSIAFNNLVDTLSEEDIKIDLAIDALGEDNNAFLDARPNLRREVVEYLKVNDLSQYARDGINYLLTQFRTNPEFIVNADLFKAGKIAGQTINEPNLAIRIGFNKQATIEGIRNFGNVLAELLKDNINSEFEGSLMRVIFLANGINVSNTISNTWLGDNFMFTSNNGNSLLIDFENNELAGEFLRIKNLVPDAKLGNFLNLIELLDNNSFAQIDIDCDQIKKWKILAQHSAPKSVLDKINALPSSWTNDFEIQSVDNATGTVVNLDYFSIKIKVLPENPTTKVKFTADEFLVHIRKNINNFVSGSTFNPYCKFQSMCDAETKLWNSDNPLGSIIYIDISGDDGVVVLTEKTNRYWYFMTMNAPYAGNHPVSGTRQFGYEQNSDGSYNFFVRGVDRIDSNAIENTLYITTLGNPLFGADGLWSSFQQKTNAFVNKNKGESIINAPVKHRPDWEDVRDVLKGVKPISELGCK